MGLVIVLIARIDIVAIGRSERRQRIFTGGSGLNKRAEPERHESEAEREMGSRKHGRDETRLSPRKQAFNYSFVIKDLCPDRHAGGPFQFSPAYPRPFDRPQNRFPNAVT